MVRMNRSKKNESLKKYGRQKGLGDYIQPIKQIIKGLRKKDA